MLMDKNIFIFLILISEQIFSRGNGEVHRGEPRYLGPYAWGILIVLFSIVWWKLRKSGYKKGRKKKNKPEK
jgi:hypothetical protein